MTNKNFKQRVFHYEKILVKESSWITWLTVRKLVQYGFLVVFMGLKILFRMLLTFLRFIFSTEAEKAVREARIENELEGIYGSYNRDPIYDPDNLNNPERKRLEEQNIF